VEERVREGAYECAKRTLYPGLFVCSKCSLPGQLELSCLGISILFRILTNFSKFPKSNKQSAHQQECSKGSYDKYRLVRHIIFFRK
jgi:hypothetical protein